MKRVCVFAHWDKDNIIDDYVIYYLKALKYYEKDGKHEPLRINIQIKLAELMMLYNHPDAFPCCSFFQRCLLPHQGSPHKALNL